MRIRGRGGEPNTYASSTGQALTASGWLDTHFEACRPEYEAMLASVGIEPGWRVLDAGCGSGSYLPLLTELVGTSGYVAALDLASDNISLVENRLASWDLICPIAARTASLRALPYPDDAFDAVWCANTTLHFSNEELPSVLAELRRVVRPGGLVAVKDLDTNLLRFYPADPFLIFHLSEAGLCAEQETAESIGSLRGRELKRWLERSGLTEVWQRTTLIERWAPLRTVERQFFGDWLAYLAGLAEERGVPEADLQAWRSVIDHDAPNHLLDHPEFYACEGQVVAVGRVPGGGG
ncbi:MAG TPA: methyltransferase domain-containing protein [Rubrobacteraceae bacterium]|nr:methyltransferase domain-containing protein [Rubrobacteraceae bacterium]